MSLLSVQIKNLSLFLAAAIISCIETLVQALQLWKYQVQLHHTPFKGSDTPLTQQGFFTSEISKKLLGDKQKSTAPLGARLPCAASFPAWRCPSGPLDWELLEGTWFSSTATPTCGVASCLATSECSAEQTCEWKKEQTSELEQTQSSHLTLPELICFAGREYGCVPDPVRGYIPSAANNKHIKCHMQQDGNRRDFSFFKRKSKKKSNVLVVSCSTRKNQASPGQVAQLVGTLPLYTKGLWVWFLGRADI